MRTHYMARVGVEAKIENAIDASRALLGQIEVTAVRSLVIREAVVDTSISMLGLPVSMLRQLGFDRFVSTRRPRVIGGPRVRIYDPVRLTILGREMLLEPMEVDDGCPVLIGQIPLEHLQLVVDMANHRVEKSPANGGEWILDMF